MEQRQQDRSKTIASAGLIQSLSASISQQFKDQISREYAEIEKSGQSFFSRMTGSLKLSHYQKVRAYIEVLKINKSILEEELRKNSGSPDRNTIQNQISAIETKINKIEAYSKGEINSATLFMEISLLNDEELRNYIAIQKAKELATQILETEITQDEIAIEPRNKNRDVEIKFSSDLTKRINTLIRDSITNNSQIQITNPIFDEISLFIYKNYPSYSLKKNVDEALSEIKNDIYSQIERYRNEKEVNYRINRQLSDICFKFHVRVLETAIDTRDNETSRAQVRDSLRRVSEIRGQSLLNPVRNISESVRNAFTTRAQVSETLVTRLTRPTLSVVSGLIVGNIPGVITTVASTATTSLARDRIRLRENRFRKNLSSIIKGEATSKNDPFTKLDLSVYISKELDDNDVIKLLTYIKLQEELGISLFINSTDDTEDNPNRVFLLELNYAKVKSKVKDYLKDKGQNAKSFLEIPANSITHNQIASSIREIHKSQQTKEVLISTGAAAGKAVLAGAVTALLPLVGQPVAAFILDKIEDLLDLIPENIFEMLKDFLLNSANRTVLGLKILLENIADYTSKKMVPDLNRRFVVILKFLNATFNLSSDNKEHQELKQQLNSLIGKLESSYIRKSDPSVSINSEVTAPDDYIQSERRTGGRSVNRFEYNQLRRDSVQPKFLKVQDPADNEPPAPAAATATAPAAQPNQQPAAPAAQQNQQPNQQPPATPQPAAPAAQQNQQPNQQPPATPQPYIPSTSLPSNLNDLARTDDLFYVPSLAYPDYYPLTEQENISYNLLLDKQKASFTLLDNEKLTLLRFEHRISSLQDRISDIKESPKIYEELFFIKSRDALYNTNYFSTQNPNVNPITNFETQYIEFRDLVTQFNTFINDSANPGDLTESDLRTYEEQFNNRQTQVLSELSNLESRIPKEDLVATYHFQIYKRLIVSNLYDQKFSVEQGILDYKIAQILRSEIYQWAVGNSNTSTIEFDNNLSDADISKIKLEFLDRFFKETGYNDLVSARENLMDQRRNFVNAMHIQTSMLDDKLRFENHDILFGTLNRTLDVNNAVYKTNSEYYYQIYLDFSDQLPSVDTDFQIVREGALDTLENSDKYTSSLKDAYDWFYEPTPGKLLKEIPDDQVFDPSNTGFITEDPSVYESKWDMDSYDKNVAERMGSDVEWDSQIKGYQQFLEDSDSLQDQSTQSNQPQQPQPSSGSTNQNSSNNTVIPLLPQTITSPNSQSVPIMQFDRVLWRGDDASHIEMFGSDSEIHYDGNSNENFVIDFSDNNNNVKSLIEAQKFKICLFVNGKYVELPNDKISYNETEGQIKFDLSYFRDNGYDIESSKLVYGTLDDGTFTTAKTVIL